MHRDGCEIAIATDKTSTTEKKKTRHKKRTKLTPKKQKQKKPQTAVIVREICRKIKTVSSSKIQGEFHPQTTSLGTTRILFPLLSVQAKKPQASDAHAGYSAAQWKKKKKVLQKSMTVMSMSWSPPRCLIRMQRLAFCLQWVTVLQEEKTVRQKYDSMRRQGEKKKIQTSTKGRSKVDI